MVNREPTEMELRVAKVLCCRDGCEAAALPAKCHAHYHLNKVRAAIRAMRESTNDMMNAGSSVIAEIHQQEIRGEEAGKRHLEEIPALRWSYRQEARESWRAMIDAASPPT